MQAEEHLGSACESAAPLCPKHVCSISPAKCQEEPANPTRLPAILAAAPSPLQRKFYISLNLKPNFQKCQFTSPTSKSTQHPCLLPAAPGMPSGTGSAAGNTPFSILRAPPQPSCRPPAWSWGQFNQPSFPKLSQPARAIVTAGKNRQAPFSPALWGAPIHLFKQISKRAAALSSPLSSPGLTMA